MNSSPLVSIVTPSFNQAESLEKTILSVLKQDYPQIEYILIDGGSTDGSQEIIEKYKERLAYWISEKDNGQAHAINKGLAKATGEIRTFLNSDDQLLPNAVSKIVEMFNDHPEAGAVHGDCIVIDSMGNNLGEEKGHPVSFHKLMKYGQSGVIQPTCFFRSNIIHEVGFLDESLFMSLDYDLILRVAQKSKLVYFPSPLAKITYTVETKTFSHPLHTYRECAEIRSRYGKAWSMTLRWQYWRFRLFRALPNFLQRLIRRTRNSIEDRVILGNDV